MCFWTLIHCNTHFGKLHVDWKNFAENENFELIASKTNYFVAKQWNFAMHDCGWSEERFFRTKCSRFIGLKYFKCYPVDTLDAVSAVGVGALGWNTAQVALIHRFVTMSVEVFVKVGLKFSVSRLLRCCADVGVFSNCHLRLQRACVALITRICCRKLTHYLLIDRK